MDESKKIAIEELEVITGGSYVTYDTPCGCDEVNRNSVGRNGEATKILYMCDNCGRYYWMDM